MVTVYFVEFISLLTQLLIFAIFARVILSWLRVPPRGIFFTLFVETTEPILRPIRRLVPPVGGVLDISPLLAFVLLDIFRSIFLALLK